MIDDVHPSGIDALVYADHGAPFEILGPHPVAEGKISFRMIRPWAKSAVIVDDSTGARYEMEKARPEGLFVATATGEFAPEGYHFETVTYDDQPEIFHDPYAFPPSLTDFDLYLLGEGRHLNTYEKLGAHLHEHEGVKGVRFAVWAPNAKRVSVVGHFNRWDARVHPMRMLGNSGIWELFIPELGLGTIYKYDVRSHVAGYNAMKADPYGFQAEVRPATASIVAEIDSYTWQDKTWMDAREKRDPLSAPMSIYEVHLGSWRRKAGMQPGGDWLTYRELADSLITYVKDMGYTHIELMPVSEHPFDGSWGYQTTGYYAPTSRFGTPQDFMYFVDKCHQNKIGVILDWVPAHFPKDGHALSYFDGTHLYEHADSRKGEHPDWGTYIFNFGRNEVRNFLLANALFWLKKYHIDGLRVDAVSSMIYLNFSRQEGQWEPNIHGGNENLEAISFLREMNEIVHRECPGTVTIAEESTSWAMVSRPTYLGGLGFTFKWDMGWMHDTLKYLQLDPIYRRYHHNQITFSMMYAFSENFVQALSHDEVVHGKGSLINKCSGDWWQKFATLRALFGYQYTHSGKKLNFMGQEFGQWAEWSEARSLDWHLLEFPMHKGMQNWVRDLNKLYAFEPALYEQDIDWRGFQWIDANDAENSTFSFIRFAKDTSDFLVMIVNFTPMPRSSYTIGVPAPGYYKEVLNSDAAIYGGSNLGNMGGVTASDSPRLGFSHSLTVTVPPLSCVILKLARRA